MAMVTQLRNELLLKINDFLADEDLITLFATCRKFHASTEEGRKFAMSQHHPECHYIWPRVWMRKFMVLADFDTLDPAKRLCCGCGRWHDIDALRGVGAGRGLTAPAMTSKKTCCFGRCWTLSRLPARGDKRVLPI